jgi:biopolymer transport protein ExbD
MASSKLRSASAEPEAECALDMSPMIDMVFLLLIFFIVNATAIIVQKDPAVRPPVAVNSKPQEVKEGRIVVNIRPDGTFTAEDFNTILPGEEEIHDMVKNMKERHQSLGVVSKLHLRGDKDAVFRYCRTAIRGAARAGVDQVVFGVFVREP